MSEAVWPRHSRRPFPPYSYVPGSGTPHPVSDPRGHMHGITEPIPEPLDPKRWRESETYLHAVDLFNHRFYWEAHEAWESLWHAAGHRGLIADFLKGLIKLAAAGVKFREGNPVGVRRHLARSQELLGNVEETKFCGIELAALNAHLLQFEEDISEDFSLVILLAPPPA